MRAIIVVTASALVILTAGFGGQAVAGSADATSPAGTAGGMVIIFSPAFAAAPRPVSSAPPILPPLNGRFAAPLIPPSPPTPVLPGILLLTPTPATGSLVVPLRRPSFTQLQLVIPGPNPAQNTTISLAQLLQTILASAQRPSSPVTVLATPAPP
jgi:hypothetical protein